jgi:Alw26I/Eco31I/Esp3I family type II restriction endonuclease
LYGDDLLKSLPIIFSTPKRNLEQIPRALADWVSWLDQQFIPEEPSLLSPGAYSNAPDRFDGFHSDNLCCRSTADKGRSKSNLASYVTDRRVFEHWAAGDWVAADRMMGALRAAQFEKQSCKNGHPGPCSADHIGPISLGFTHRPCFQALCKSCNSAKNNRMSASDIRFLMEHEKKGETVSSWHSKALWNLRKLSGAEDNETALRLSKLLRDNRHVLMAALKRIADAGYYVFLTTLLELEHADYDVTFINLKIVDHITHFDQMDKSKRVTKYAAEQKARRCRVALQELAAYFEKENRSSFVVGNEASEVALERCLSELQKLGSIPLDKQIGAAVLAGDAEFAPLIPDINAIDKKQYAAARAALEDHMDIVGGLLSSMWNDDRYVRS